MSMGNQNTNYSREQERFRQMVLQWRAETFSYLEYVNDNMRFLSIYDKDINWVRMYFMQN